MYKVCHLYCKFVLFCYERDLKVSLSLEVMPILSNDLVQCLDILMTNYILISASKGTASQFLEPRSGLACRHTAIDYRCDQ